MFSASMYLKASEKFLRFLLPSLCNRLPFHEADTEWTDSMPVAGRSKWPIARHLTSSYVWKLLWSSSSSLCVQQAALSKGRRAVQRFCPKLTKFLENGHNFNIFCLRLCATDCCPFKRQTRSSREMTQRIRNRMHTKVLMRDSPCFDFPLYCNAL